MPGPRDFCPGGHFPKIPRHEKGNPSKWKVRATSLETEVVTTGLNSAG